MLAPPFLANLLPKFAEFCRECVFKVGFKVSTSPVALLDATNGVVGLPKLHPFPDPAPEIAPFPVTTVPLTSSLSET